MFSHICFNRLKNCKMCSGHKVQYSSFFATFVRTVFPSDFWSIMLNLPSFQKLHSIASHIVHATQIKLWYGKKMHEIGLLGVLGIEICIVHMCFYFACNRGMVSKATSRVWCLECCEEHWWLLWHGQYMNRWGLYVLRLHFSGIQCQVWPEDEGNRFPQNDGQ